MIKVTEEDALDIERLSINCRISLKIFKIKSCVKDPSVIKSKLKNMRFLFIRVVIQCYNNTLMIGRDNYI